MLVRKSETVEIVLAAALSLCVGSCAAQSERQTPTAPDEPSAAGSEPERGAVSDDSVAVHVSQSIREKCGIEMTKTFFAYDSASVRTRANPLLKKVAICFTRGPLAGEVMRLVGHADPRGGEEYNMLLGERRAAAVEQKLIAHGVEDEQILTTSRGELEARGEDPGGWAKDRRVEIVEG